MSVIVINLAAIEKLGIAKTEYAEMLQAVFALSEVLPFVPVEKQREIHELIEASKFTTGEQLRAWVGKAFLMTGCLEQDFFPNTPANIVNGLLVCQRMLQQRIGFDFLSDGEEKE